MKTPNVSTTKNAQNGHKRSRNKRSENDHGSLEPAQSRTTEQQNDIETVRKFLANGGDVNQQDPGNGLTFVMYACKMQYYDLLDELVLLAAGTIDVNMRNQDGENCLWLLFQNYSTQPNDDKARIANYFAVFIEQCNADFRTLYDGYTLLSHAIKCKELEFIRVLTALPGFPIDALNKGGLTNLHIALENELYVAAKILVDAGADYNIEDDLRRTTRGIAAKMAAALSRPGIYELPSMEELLSRLQKYQEELFLRGTLRGHHEHIDDFLTYGGNINARDANGYTAMMHACITYNWELMDFLLAIPTLDLNVVNHRLNLTCTSCLLLEQFRHQNNRVQETILTYLTKFIERGADVNILLGGHSILHRAVVDNNTDLVKILVKLPEVDINLRGKHGETALQIALDHVNLAPCNVLLKAGADVTNADNNNKTAFDIAQGRGIDLNKLIKTLDSSSVRYIGL
jgi:ankyrin repeat protein